MASLKSLTTAFVAMSALLGGAFAHPGEEHNAEKRKRDIEDRDLAEAHARLATAKCSGSPTHHAMKARAAARRSLTAQLLREKRGIVHKSIKSKRDQIAADKWMGKCHDQGSHHGEYDASTPEATIFTSNATHALTPQSIVGPYYVLGEYIRSDVTEDEPGIPVHLDLQFIDINTCQVVPNMLVDIWHANATGVYSGVRAATGTGGLNSTFLRGVQVTDHDGVVTFDTIYPGFYLGRVQHIHIVSRRGGKILSNGTYTGGAVNHVGQLYFDQELNGQVALMEPYRHNWFPMTTNAGDFLVAQASTADYDPFVDYVMLSDDANDGLLMWLTVGINGTADYTNTTWAAATYGEHGGVADPMPSFSPPPKMSGASGLPPMSRPAPTAVPAAKPNPLAQRPKPQPWGPCRTNNK